MARTVAIGKQDFSALIEKGYFYVDKTNFIKEWWENGDDVTLITRPRRFGKTLTMSMLDYFFSVSHAGRSDLFENLSIWKEEKYRKLQGTYPVIFLSFADVKRNDFEETCGDIMKIISREYRRWAFIMGDACFSELDRIHYNRILSGDYNSADLKASISQLSEYLYNYYEKKPIILLDEYDTPMQEAYVNGYWDQMSVFIRGLFHSSFKTNPYMERAVMTGIMRIGKESVFSDLNNLQVIPVTSAMYQTVFGFTEDEVESALDEYGMKERMPDVKRWYDGFRFGDCGSIYNPWSITKYLKEKEFALYWVNTSSNVLAEKLIQRAGPEIKMAVEDLLKGHTFQTAVDEEIVFSDLDSSETAVWSLLLACGYLKITETVVIDSDMGREGLEYRLALTNSEIVVLFRKMVHGWFAEKRCGYNEFISALLAGDLKSMNLFMNKTSLATISMFDAGRRSSEKTEPERFYHGFVLGLIVDLRRQYRISSNRESGFGRYDVLMKPLDSRNDVMILEFKICGSENERDLKDTVKSALNQILDKRYAASLEAEGISGERIRIYGLAFRGKEVLIDGGRISDCVIG